MFFCPKCDNGFYITKTLPDLNKQSGGASEHSESSLQPEDLIEKIINQNKLSKNDFLNINLDEITKSNNYKKLSSKEK